MHVYLQDSKKRWSIASLLSIRQMVKIFRQVKAPRTDAMEKLGKQRVEGHRVR